MIGILFVCHGNICRSTMAQYVMEDLVRKAGLEGTFYIDSAATSTEEIGSPPHPGTRRKLREMGVPCGEHRARQLTRRDYEQFDLLIVPGAGFGAPGHVRISYCVQTEMLQRALPKFKALADSYR